MVVVFIGKLFYFKTIQSQLHHRLQILFKILDICGMWFLLLDSLSLFLEQKCDSHIIVWV